MTQQSFNNAGNVGHAAPVFSYHYNKASDFWSPIQSNDFKLNLSAGLISGMRVATVFGRNSDVDEAEDVWNGGGIYGGFTTGAAETLSIFSSDTRDSITGLGMRSIKIFGLDSDFREVNETVNLNGTGHALTSNSFKRLIKAYGDEAGLSGSNLGDVTVRHTDSLNTFAVLPIGYGQTQNCCYTVPSGYKGYTDGLMGGMFDNTANKGILALWSRAVGKCARVVHPFSVSTESATFFEPYSFMEFDEMTDLSIRVLSIQNANGDISASFSIIIIKQ